MKNISSVNNQYIKDLSLLKNKKNRIQENKYIIEGHHLVEEAYKAGVLKEVLTTDENITFDVPTILVTDAIISKLSSTKEPQGIIGIVEMQNLGTIIRSSAALGIDAIIVSLDTVDEYNDKVLRATQGAIFKIPIFRMNISDAIAKLKKDDTKIIVTSLQNSSDLKTIQKPKKFGIVLGNEAKGVHSEYLKLADEIVRIEMQNDVESLNVAMSAGIIIYYLLN